MSHDSTLAALRADTHTSVSAIQQYLICPRKYELHYLKKVEPSHRPIQLAFGSAVHKCIATTFHEKLKNKQQEPSKEELQASFVDAWRAELNFPVPVLMGEKETPNSVEQLGIAMVGLFHEQAPRLNILEVELAFSVGILDPDSGEILKERLVGAMDGVAEVDEIDPVSGQRKVVVIELKTGAKKWSASQQENPSIQACAYSHAGFSLSFGYPEIQIQLLTKTAIPSFNTYNFAPTERDRLDFLRVAAGVLKAVQAGAFYPIRASWACSSCPLAAHC